MRLKWLAAVGTAVCLFSSSASGNETAPLIGIFNIDNLPPLTLPAITINPISNSPPNTFAAPDVRSGLSITYGPKTAAQQTNDYNTLISDYDALNGVVTIPAGSTVLGTNAVAGYVENFSTNSNIGGTNGVALYGQALSAATNAYAWGINTVTTDSITAAANGFTGQIIQSYEADMLVYNTTTFAQGISLNGGFRVQPFASNGFTVNCNGCSGTNHWGTAFWSVNGAATIAFLIGDTAHSGSQVANLSSQLVEWEFTDTASATQRILLENVVPTAAGGTLTLTTLNGDPANISASGGLTIGTGLTLSALLTGGSSGVTLRSSGAGVVSIGNSTDGNGLVVVDPGATITGSVAARGGTAGLDPRLTTNAGDLAISSSTGNVKVGGAGAITLNEPVLFAGSTPVLSACGTSPTLVATSNDHRGEVVTGSSGTPAACTVTFGTAFASRPFCVVSSFATSAALNISSVSASALAVTMTAANSSRFEYMCIG